MLCENNYWHEKLSCSKDKKKHLNVASLQWLVSKDEAALQIYDNSFQDMWQKGAGKQSI